MKAYLLWDALERNRTDGALVRLTTTLRPGEDWEEGDKRLEEVTITVDDLLPSYIPS